MAETTGKKQLIGSLTKGLMILEYLMEQDRLGVTELGRMLGVNKSSAYRLLITLEDRGFVRQEPETGKYQLGMKLASFRAKVFDGIELRDLARPYLKLLTERTREASNLCILSNGQGVIIEKQDSREKISANLYVGMAEPLHCTALGKALLSSLSEQEQKRLLRSTALESHTPKTMTDEGQILEELRRAAQRGAALDDEEFSLGMRCIAAPVFNHKGEAVASIGISGPLDRIRTEMLDEYVKAVREAARELSAQLGSSVK